MEHDRRSGSPVLRRKLDRETNGPSIGKLVGMAVGAAAALGAIGVVVAASVPSMDLFGLYAAREKTAVVAPESEKKLTPPVKPSAPPAPEPVARVDPNAQIPDEWTAEDPPVAEPGPTDLPVGENDPVPVKPPRRPAPRRSVGERSVERDISYLRELKPAVQLPALADTGDTTLSYLNEAEKIEFSDVAIQSGVAALGEGGQFKLKREGSKPRWTILLKPGEPATAASDPMPAEPPSDEKADGPASKSDEASEKPAEADASGESTDEKPADENSIETTPSEDKPAEEKPAEESFDNDKPMPTAMKLAVETPVAEIWCVQSSLMFRWLPEAKDIALAEQLRNTAVRFSLGTHHQQIALREATTQPIYTLDLADRSKEIASTIENPPRTDLLHLQVIDASDMPVNAYYQNDQDATPIPIAKAAPVEDNKKPTVKPKPKPGSTPPKDPTPRVTVLFDKFVDGEQPQIWVDPRLENGNEIKIRVSARIVRGNIIDDLTTKSLELYRLPRDQRLAGVERDWKNAHDAVVGIERRIIETKQGVNATVPVKTLESRLLAARKAHKKLDDEIRRIQAELAWVEAAKLLISKIDGHGQFKYRVFAKSGDLEIDLIRGGLE